MLELIVGVALGFLASQLSGCLAHKRQAHGLLVALRSDTETCAEYFQEYRTQTAVPANVEPYWAPAYRLPTATWAAAMPYLADVLTAEEINVLARFFQIARQMNYSLDKQAETTYFEGAQEHNRTAVKVSHALDAENDQPPLVDRVEAAINAAIGRIDIPPVQHVIKCVAGAFQKRPVR